MIVAKEIIKIFGKRHGENTALQAKVRKANTPEKEDESLVVTNKKEKEVMRKALNCWEYMKCGRELGGDKADELGICRVASAKHLNETNSGLNGGRICFAVVGSFCEGEIQGTFAKKFASCRDCEFYKLI